MRLSGKLNSVDLSSDLKSILFRNFKAVEGLIFSTVEDTKQNTCSATFKFIGKDIPFTVGKEYTFDIDDSTPVDDSFIIVGDAYRLLKAEINPNDDKFVTYTFFGKNQDEKLVISSPLDLMAFKTGDIVYLYVQSKD